MSDETIKRPKIVEDLDLTGLLDSMDNNVGVMYLKDRTRVRLLPILEGRSPVLPITTSFNGKSRIKYLIGVQNLAAKGEEQRVFLLLLSKKVVKAMLQYATEGWDLFGKETGRGLILIKSGSGLATEVTISPSPNPIAIPDDVMEEWYDFDPKTVAEEYQKYQAERTDTATAEEVEEPEEEPAPKAPTKPAAKAKTKKPETGW